MADFTIKRNDLLPVLNANLVDKEGAIVDLTGATVNFHMKKAGASTLKIDTSATVVTAASGSVRYSWAGTDTDTAGDYEAEFEVTFSSTKPETFPTNGYIHVRIVEDLA